MDEMKSALRALKNVMARLGNESSVSDDELVEIGEFCFNLGMADDARKVFEQAVSIEPPNCKALNNLGVLSFERGDYEAARAYFLRAIEHNPDDAVAKANLVRVIEEQAGEASNVQPEDPDESAWLATGDSGEKSCETVAEPMLVCHDPIFVVASPRSGTSQLAFSLARHSQNWVSRESHFLHYLAKLAKDIHALGTEWNAVSYTWWLAKEGVTAEELLRFIGHGINALFTNRSGGLRWIDHTPGYAIIMRDLAVAFPGARFIHIVRDGRDVVNSMIHSDHHRNVGCDWALDFRAACKTWAAHVEAALRYEDTEPRRVLRVYFESVSTGNDEEFKRIHDFLELPYEEATTRLFKEGKRLNSSFSAKERDRMRWQNSWTDEQRALFGRICGPLLVRLGYEKDDSWAESSVLAASRHR